VHERVPAIGEPHSSAGEHFANDYECVTVFKGEWRRDEQATIMPLFNTYLSTEAVAEGFSELLDV
jgi:hypothetical protein